MEDLASPSVLPGPSHVSCWHPTERQIRKTGTHNIFQGVNLRQLRRLFQVAGEQNAEHRARMVWTGGSRRDQEDQEEDDVRAEVEIGLAQALVGLRVRARTRSGIRAEGPWDGNRRVRVSAPHRSGGDASSGLASHVDSDDESEQANIPEGLDTALSDKEMVDLTSNRSGARARDPDRHLHRIRH